MSHTLANKSSVAQKRWSVRSLFHVRDSGKGIGVRNVLAQPDDREFSLALGGPLYQLYIRTKLLTSPLGLLRRRVVVISLICWGPLLILSALAGQALGGVTVPFLLDADVHVRFLAAIPLLIIAELIVHRRMQLKSPSQGSYARDRACHSNPCRWAWWSPCC